VTVLVGLAVWYLLARYNLVRDLLLPSPQQVWERFLEVRGDLASELARTLGRVLGGFVLGTTLGLAVAFAASWSRVLHHVIEPVIQVFKPVPAIALAPFAILWFGLGLKGIIFLVVWGCFFITVIDGTEAIKNVPKIYLWAAASLGTSRRRSYLRITLPYIMPGLIGGLRVSMVIAFNQTILGEFNASAGGLGGVIIKGYTFNQTDILFLGIILVVLAAIVADAALVYLSHRVVGWAR
jgi:ABC-type nitrate/sulfonate/bicarbonate transport system permease component